MTDFEELNTQNTTETVEEPIVEEVAVVEEMVEEVVEETTVEPLDPEAILEVRNLTKYFPVATDFFGRPTTFLKAVGSLLSRFTQ